MPSALLILLGGLALGLGSYGLYRWVHRRGFNAGYRACLEVGRELDTLLHHHD